MSRRLSAGRSPLVRKQSQITSFFTPGKQQSNPSPTPTPTPDPSKSLSSKKPRLVLPPSPSPSPSPSPTPNPSNDPSSLEGIVGKKMKVFWPLDEAWYEGRVVSFNRTSGKHLIRYDDDQEEELDLGAEKFQLVQPEERQPAKSLRRLRRMSGSMDVASVQAEEGQPAKTLRRLRRMSGSVDVASGQGGVQMKALEDEDDDDDDSVDDEDWGKGLGKALVDDESEEVELEDEEDEEVFSSSRRGRQSSSSLGSKRKKKVDVKTLDCAKKVKFDADEDKNKPEVCLEKAESCSTTTIVGKKSK